MASVDVTGTAVALIGTIDSILTSPLALTKGALDVTNSLLQLIDKARDYFHLKAHSLILHLTADAVGYLVEIRFYLTSYLTWKASNPEGIKIEEEDMKILSEDVSKFPYLPSKLLKKEELKKEESKKKEHHSKKKEKGEKKTIQLNADFINNFVLEKTEVDIDENDITLVDDKVLISKAMALTKYSEQKTVEEKYTSLSTVDEVLVKAMSRIVRYLTSLKMYLASANPRLSDPIWIKKAVKAAFLSFIVSVFLKFSHVSKKYPLSLTYMNKPE